MPLRLEVGKRYVTRSGWITPPIQLNNFIEGYPFEAGENTWTEAGRTFHHGEDVDDLVEEYSPVAVGCPEVPGIPSGYRVVRFGLVKVGDLWMGSCGSPLKFTHEVDNDFHALIVEKIKTEETSDVSV